MTERSASPSLLDKLDEMVPTPLEKFDAFPKLEASYKARSESRGFLTLFVGFLAFLLVLNDLGEYIWGWPDYEFSIDPDTANDMNVNVDIIVNMPCQYLSVDLRDAVGDRLYLSDGFRRDGTLFDIGQATALKDHAEALSARQAIAQSRKSRGLFATIFRKTTPGYRPTYNFQPSGSACRVYGTVQVKKVTANLHITTLGHGYASAQHVDHRLMNLSHVINEFSFGPFFPDIAQPLDNSFELTHEPFVAYQYFLHVVPTTYIAPRSSPLKTHQYSVTHYTRKMEHNRGVPGIFFKFDMEPLSITIFQRTTTLIQLMIRCVGVIGGIFVCMGYAVKITTHAVEAVSGGDKSSDLVAAEATGAGLRKKWGGGELRSRAAVKPGWIAEGGSPYASYANTPVSGTFSIPSSPYLNNIPYTPSNGTYGATLSPNPAVQGSGYGLGLTGTRSPSFGPSTSPRLQPLPMSPAISGTGSQYTPSVPSAPTTPNIYSVFPPTPNPANGPNGFPRSPPVPGSSPSMPPPPPSRGHVMNGNGNGHIHKKDD
ncbi:Endoplasmic reticulum-Golgi intermediate compartment protein [Abortiporus biennis]